jgi:hypothetical protein
VEDWAEIRRLCRAERMPVKAIARVMGVSRNTVRAAVGSSGPPRYVRKPGGSVVDAVEPRIRELLQAYPGMPATVIAERIGPGPPRARHADAPNHRTVARFRDFAERANLSALQRCSSRAAHRQSAVLAAQRHLPRRLTYTISVPGIAVQPRPPGSQRNGIRPGHTPRRSPLTESNRRPSPYHIQPGRPWNRYTALTSPNAISHKQLPARASSRWRHSAPQTAPWT